MNHNQCHYLLLKNFSLVDNSKHECCQLLSEFPQIPSLNQFQWHFQCNLQGFLLISFNHHHLYSLIRWEVPCLNWYLQISQVSFFHFEFHFFRLTHKKLVQAQFLSFQPLLLNIQDYWYKVKDNVMSLCSPYISLELFYCILCLIYLQCLLLN